MDDIRQATFVVFNHMSTSFITLITAVVEVPKGMFSPASVWSAFKVHVTRVVFQEGVSSVFDQMSQGCNLQCQQNSPYVYLY